ncbi:MAG: glycosyltransferase [Anaerolineae bacterium]|jgi:D-inositol-3-phosphate glycosyltransferase|nr:glycosyltransferase [Anaerolineae bacterium]
MTIRRIAMLSVHTCPLATLGGKETGGMNVYVRDLSRELSRRGIYVDVFTRTQNPHLPRVSARLGHRGRVIHLPAGPEAPYDKNTVFDHLPEFIEGVTRFAEEECVSYDVLYSHYWLSGWVARALRERWGTPIVQMFHTLGHMKNRVAQRESDRETGRRIEVETEIVHFSDRLVAATPSEKAQLTWLYGADPHKISVISPGVDLRRFHPIDKNLAKTAIGAPEHNRLILFVGRVEPLKGIDTLLRAMALVAQRHPDWTCNTCVAIIGGNPSQGEQAENAEMARLQALRAELGIGDLVTFLGAKDQDTLQYYYSAAEMVIMPSHYESFGMVALEAMACGTPVVASEVGGLAFVVRDGVTGFHVPERDPEALAAKVERLLSDDVLRMRLGRRAACWAESYGWPVIADRLLDLFHELAGVQLAAVGCCGA